MQKKHNMDSAESLKLSKQVCFPIYSVSRLLTKAYKPYLDKMGLTYPQYLVLMVLWENDGLTVNHISEKLLLNTNTVSPLLKRMEKLDFLQRKRSKVDERSVVIHISEKGLQLKKEASHIPDNLLKVLLTDNIKLPEILHLKDVLDEWITVLSENNKQINS